MLSRVISAGALFLLASGAVVPLEAQIDPELLSGMKARTIGPAGMSGRVAAVEAVASNPDIVYVGGATGGVWKSVNGGVSWEPIFDDQPVAAIGAVAVFQASPDIVWVGTGEGNPRNSASVGNGIYKSMDGGRSWTHLGLDESERIHRILLHPTDPEIAYVAAMGRTWGENDQRGVFKTVDGGRIWVKVLYTDERTGAADLEMDPSNPNKLIAAMWDYRRWPWSFRSGGPGSGLHLTVDGGRTWRELTEHDGLPAGDLGRIGLGIAPSDPNVVYALIEAKKNALYRSDDGGHMWKKVGEGSNVGNRPFYYADLRVDPKDANRVYSLWSRVSVSNDGGKTFERLGSFRTIHPDHHAMWINPNDPSHIIEGNDGGVYFSYDRGKTWRFVSNLPLAQYYHISIDMQTPYNIYGGLQDNGSWRGPSSVWENGGIRNHHWEEVGFGDGFATLSDPNDAMTGYSMSQEGFLRRWDLRTGERKDIRPASPDGVELRFNWNAAIAIDPFDGNTVYFGSQFVHKSTDRREAWTIISPDLTTNNPEWQKQAEAGGLTPDVTGAENFTTIITIAASPVERGVIWVGTDDGRVHVTRNGGESWTSVERNIKGVPANTWVPHIEPSKFDAATAFVVFDDHRRSNWTPYVHKTSDYGRRWKSLATADLWGYALAIEQDPVKEDLLFLGTEFGLYVTLDGGKKWMKWKHGFPTVSAMALIVQPREHDLVIGTHGRAVYVLDDIRPLRELTPETMAEPIHLFAIASAQQYRVKQTGASRFPGHGEFRGENRPYGALLTYSLDIDGLPHPNDNIERRREANRPQAQRGEESRGGEGGRNGEPKVTVEISDASGEVIRTFEGPAKLGVNRVAWNLRHDSFKRPPRGERPSFFRPSGPEVLPGSYGVRVKYGEHDATGTVEVLADPRFNIPQRERIAKYEAVMAAGALQETLTEAIERIQETGRDIDEVLKKARKEESGGKISTGTNGYGSDRELVEAANELKRSLGALEKRLWNPPETKGIVADTDAFSRVRYVQRSLTSSWDVPTPAQETYMRQAEALVREVMADFNKVFAEQVADFRRQVQEAGIMPLGPKEPLSLPGG